MEVLEQFRKVYHSSDFGVLSTISKRLDGIPFGSVVPYSFNELNEPVILVASIAEHTKNIIADSKASITIVQDGDGDAQAKGRITVAGTMVKVENDKVRDKYRRIFPESINYDTVHHFAYYELKTTAIRFIGGFGNINWIDPKDAFELNPFFKEGEKRIVNHMNADHKQDLIAYHKYFNHAESSSDDISMVGIDSYGFDIVANKKKFRFAFDSPIATSQEAREKMVSLSELCN